MNTQSTTTHNDIVSAYGPPVLSALAIIVVALAAFSHGIDWTAAMSFIGMVLAGNGIYIATKWQAAPTLLATLQSILKQFADQMMTPVPATTPTVQPTVPPETTLPTA